MTEPMIEVAALQKRYGGTRALDGLDLHADAATVLGVLGPNGAGKTTAVRILTTLSRPDAGTARVAGIDVAADPAAVKRRIGVTAQAATVDEVLTGRQNLVMVGRLSGLRRRSAQARARTLLERFSLTEAADRVVRGFSGGMRRRLDLAASLVTAPPVLFLDEPTTGLDPSSRSGMWDVIRELVADGTTLLLTTQYLEEADALADRIVVVDHGRAIADGTAGELKRRVGGARLELRLADAGTGSHTALAAAGPALAGLVAGELTVDDGGRRLQAPIEEAPGLTTRVVRALDDAGVVLDDIEIRRPSLDDVFFALTGHAAAPEPGAGAPATAPELQETVA